MQATIPHHDFTQAEMPAWCGLAPASSRWAICRFVSGFREFSLSRISSSAIADTLGRVRFQHARLDMSVCFKHDAMA
jgi:hypothetical protein